MPKKPFAACKYSKNNSRFQYISNFGDIFHLGKSFGAFLNLR